MNKSILDDIKETVIEDLTNVSKYLPVAIPSSEEDKKMLDICQDMVKSMIEDINSDDICHVLDIDRLESDWRDIKPKLTSMSDKEVLNLIDEIVERGTSDDE